MSTTLEQFENMLQSNKQHGSAIRAAAKKHPHGYAEWVRGMIAGTPYTAAGFDLARARREAAGLSRAEAMRECGRWHAGHGLWVEEQNTKRGSRQKRSGDRGAPAAASAAPGNSARSAGSKAYNARVAAYLAEGLTRGQAMNRAKKDDPGAFLAWLESGDTVDGTVAPTQTSAPARQAADQPIVTLSAEELAELGSRWEHPAFREVWGGDFDLLVSVREGRITYEDARARVKGAF